MRGQPSPSQHEGAPWVVCPSMICVWPRGQGGSCSPILRATSSASCEATRSARFQPATHVVAQRVRGSAEADDAGQSHSSEVLACFFFFSERAALAQSEDDD